MTRRSPADRPPVLALVLLVLNVLVLWFAPLLVLKVLAAIGVLAFGIGAIWMRAPRVVWWRLLLTSAVLVLAGVNLWFWAPLWWHSYDVFAAVTCAPVGPDPQGVIGDPCRVCSPSYVCWIIGCWA